MFLVAHIVAASEEVNVTGSSLLLILLILAADTVLIWFLFNHHRKPISQHLVQFLGSDITRWRFEQALNGSEEINSLDEQIRETQKDLVQTRLTMSASSNEEEKIAKRDKIDQKIQELQVKRQIIADEIRGGATQAVHRLMEEITPRFGDINQSDSNALYLEYTTVLVLISSIIVLAIIGVLNGDQLSPILASIAGYVLGRASSERRATQ